MVMVLMVRLTFIYLMQAPLLQSSTIPTTAAIQTPTRFVINVIRQPGIIRGTQDPVLAIIITTLQKRTVIPVTTHTEVNNFTYLTSAETKLAISVPLELRQTIRHKVDLFMLQVLPQIRVSLPAMGHLMVPEKAITHLTISNNYVSNEYR